MRLWVAALALWPVLGAASKPLPTLPKITDKKFIEQCVSTHNKLRSGVQPPASNMRYMTWDAALARTARAWGKKCTVQHNTYLDKKHQCHPNFTSVGETLWLGNRKIFHVANAIKLFYDEVKYYNFSTQKCSKVCGHYFQVVWDISYKVGCAATLCKEVLGIRDAVIFICNYSPRYDFPRNPYIEGRSCSNCGKGDTCKNNLCRNPERDKIIYYSRWYPPWAFTVVCDEACIAVVVLRISLMFLAFVAVYFIKKHFTNIHVAT
ncbi:GRPL2 protein, partial [Caloenas nicobarica]|nr:GRPL2 protein [Caloenas nicobarica]